MLNSPYITGAQESILILVQSASFAQSLEKLFIANGRRVSLVSTETAAYAAVKESVPSLIIERQDGIVTVLRHLRTAVMVPIVAVVNGADIAGTRNGCKIMIMRSISCCAIRLLVKSSPVCGPSCGAVSQRSNSKDTSVQGISIWISTAMKSRSVGKRSN